MQVHNSNFISFKAIFLDNDETKRTDDLLRLAENPAKKEQATQKLFDIFDKHLKKEAETKANVLFYKEDFLQRLYLTFFESLKTTKQLTTAKLLEILNSVNPSEEEKKENFRIGTFSMDKNRSWDDNRTKESKLSEEKIRKPLSSTSIEERAEKRKEIESFSDILSEKERNLLRERAKGKFYKEIAHEMNLSQTRTQYKTKSAIAKIQLNEKILPKEYELFADELIKTFNLPINKKQIINSIINNTDLVNFDRKTLFNRINVISKEFEISSKTLIFSMLKSPELFSLKPETIINNIDTTSKRLELDRKQFVVVALKQPSLFYMKPETIFKNIDDTSNLLEVDRKLYANAALSCPALFVQKSQTIFNNVDTTSKIFEIDRKLLTNTFLRLPTLFVRKPETLFNNINKASKLINVDRKALFELALSHPAMFYQKPEKIAKKVNIIKYYKQIQCKNIKRIAYSSCAEEKLYHNILAYLIKKHDNLEHLLKNSDVIAYLKTQNKVYNFSIPKNELADEFVKYAHEFSKSNFGKQIFKIDISK